MSIINEELKNLIENKNSIKVVSSQDKTGRSIQRPKDRFRYQPMMSLLMLKYWNLQRATAMQYTAYGLIRKYRCW